MDTGAQKHMGGKGPMDREFGHPGKDDLTRMSQQPSAHTSHSPAWAVLFNRLLILWHIHQGKCC